MELKSENITKISGALLEAQREMGNAAKGSKNPFFRSSYADLNAIREVAIPALNSHGISVLQPTLHKDGKNFVRTLLLHLSGEFLASDTEVILSKQNDPQANGSGISYARRYGLQSFLNIGAVDDDGEAAMGRYTKQKGNVDDGDIIIPSTKHVSSAVSVQSTPKVLSGAGKPQKKEDSKEKTFAALSVYTSLAKAKKLLDDSKISELYSKYSVSKSSDLSQEQATELLETVKGMVTNGN